MFEIFLKVIAYLLEILVFELTDSRGESGIRTSPSPLLKDIPFAARFSYALHQEIDPELHLLRSLPLLDILKHGIYTHFRDILRIELYGIGIIEIGLVSECAEHKLEE